MLRGFLAVGFFISPGMSTLVQAIYTSQVPGGILSLSSSPLRDLLHSPAYSYADPQHFSLL